MSDCGDKPVCPEIGLLAFPLLLVDLDRERAKTFEQLQSQHQRKSPKFSDIQWRERLKRAQKSPDNLRIQGSVGFGDHFRCNLVNPGQPRAGAPGDQRQLPIVFLRKTLAQIGHLLANQIGVI
ncbi:MAG: hypothetical protein Udaeo_02920 [Candidatus Udaeobacter sp.]|nr:MAG: hypothetical protein Udaeo_02920 [Candidatus Udaeobacter sp.]